MKPDNLNSDSRAEHERSVSMKRSKTIDSSLIPCAMSFIVASLDATRWGNNCNEFMGGGVIPLSIPLSSRLPEYIF